MDVRQQGFSLDAVGGVMYFRIRSGCGAASARFFRLSQYKRAHRRIGRYFYTLLARQMEQRTPRSTAAQNPNPSLATHKRSITPRSADTTPTTLLPKSSSPPPRVATRSPLSFAPSSFSTLVDASASACSFDSRPSLSSSNYKGQRKMKGDQLHVRRASPHRAPR